MANFNKLLDEEEIDVPYLKNVSTVKSDTSEVTEDESQTTEGKSQTTGGKSQKTEGDSKKSKKSKKATGNVDEVLKALMNKKETARLGLTVNKEIYDKLKTLSMLSSKSVTKVVSELLTASLEDVKINYDLVEAFDENFKEKRKK